MSLLSTRPSLSCGYTGSQDDSSTSVNITLCDVDDVVEASRRFVRTRSMSVNINDTGDEERAVGTFLVIPRS